MSHQTGIKASDDLKNVFCRCTTSDKIRLVKVGIANEKLECEATVEINSSSWREDYDSTVSPLLDPLQPCYMFYRLESRDQWLFIAYTPDEAKVRQKMLFSGTRSTVKTEFGGGFILNELIGTSIEDVLLSGYDEHVHSASLPPPLTDAEEEKKLIKEVENSTEVSVDTRQKTHSGLSFPLTDELQDALGRFKRKELNYLQLRIDLTKELIYLTDSGNHAVGDLQRVAPVDDAYYHVYRYDHSFGGKSVSSLVFIYSMPGYKAPIKARMLYSSCKSTLMDDLAQTHGLEFDKRLEIQDQAITEEYLMSEVHPPAVEVKEKFLKPKAPGRRGSPKRLNKVGNN